MEDTFSIQDNTKRKATGLPFLEIKNGILGKKYEMSLVFASKSLAQKMNKLYRGKTYVPNVLSFPYSKTSGEIFIQKEVAKKEAPKFDMKYDEYLVFLFIHGCLHLKGYEHSSTMENREKYFLQKYYVGKKK